MNGVAYTCSLHLQKLQSNSNIGPGDEQQWNSLARRASLEKVQTTVPDVAHQRIVAAMAAAGGAPSVPSGASPAVMMRSTSAARVPSDHLAACSATAGDRNMCEGGVFSGRPGARELR